MITLEQFAAAVPCSLGTAKQWFPHILKAASKWGIGTRYRLAGFIAQMSQESGAFSRFEEGMNYSSTALASVWPSRFATDIAAVIKSPNALAQKLGRSTAHPADQKGIANATYGGRFGNVEGTDDGWNYRGRGPKQITFKDNYHACGNAIGLDLVANPHLLLIPEYGADSAGWYWASHGCNEMMDRKDFRATTKAINGGFVGHEDGNTTGVDDRVEHYLLACRVLGIAP